MSDEELPKTLYHYTSNDAFISIIEMKKIWLSDLRLSNDTSEGEYTFNLVKEILEEANVRTDPLFIEIMGNTSTALGFCFSGNGDMLSQWRAYSLDGKGICIGFRREFFVDLLNKEEPSSCPLKFKKVVYDRTNQKEHLIERLDLENINLPEQITPDLEDQPLNREKLQHAENNKEYLRRALPVIPDLFIFKNSFFQEEQEWRLFRNITIKTVKEEDIPIEFSASNDRVVPHLKFPNGELLSSAIDEVILGPKNNTPKYVIEALLERNGFENVIVKPSQGSYR